MVNIQIWADFVCPYSYIGIKNLTRAIERLQHKDINIQLCSYLQYPFVTSKNEERLSEIISNKYGISEIEARTYMEDVAALAIKHQLTMNVNNLQPKNTFTAHRLLKLASRYQVQMRFFDKLTNAYFIEGEILNDEGLLRQLSLEVGIQADEIDKVLKNSAKYEGEVESDLMRAQRLGIAGTPFFMFDHQIKITGIKSVEQFEDILTIGSSQ